MPACKWRSSAILTYPNVRCVPVLENRHFRLGPDLNLNTPYNEFGGHGIATTISPVNALPLRLLRRWQLSLLVQVRDPGPPPPDAPADLAGCGSPTSSGRSLVPGKPNRWRFSAVGAHLLTRDIRAIYTWWVAYRQTATLQGGATAELPSPLCCENVQQESEGRGQRRLTPNENKRYGTLYISTPPPHLFTLRSVGAHLRAPAARLRGACGLVAVASVFASAPDAAD